jgi:hypothetical protein
MAAHSVNFDSRAELLTHPASYFDLSPFAVATRPQNLLAFRKKPARAVAAPKSN